MELELNSKLKKTLNLLEDTNTSIFLTGRAGTGKSTFLKYFTENTLKECVTLAPTGVAAINAHGQTIHSFFGFSPRINKEKARIYGAKSKQQEKYECIETLIIDEVSMVRADLLDCIDSFLRAVKQNNLPFGGIQMLFVGDLFQLPPIVSREEEKEYFSTYYKSPYFFSAKCLKDLEIETIELDEVYRQSDSDFINLLDVIREGSVEDHHLEKLNKQVFNNDSDESIIKLCTINNKVDAINAKHLEALSSEKFTYKAITTGEFNSKNARTKEALDLKEGAMVMFLNNHPNKLWVNGTMGTIKKLDEKEIIVELEDGSHLPVKQYEWDMLKYKFDLAKGILNQEVVGTFTQYPLKLAWAVTIHKAQGTTLSKAIIDIGSGTFAHGQFYVAISRCKSLEGIKFERPIRKSDIIVDERILHFMQNGFHEQERLIFDYD